MFKLQIIGNSLIVTNTATNKDVLDIPTSQVYYDTKELNDRDVLLLYNLSDYSDKSRIYSEFISNLVNESDEVFTVETIKEFCRENLGNKQGGGDGNGVTDVTEGNALGELYIKGDAITNESLRFTAVSNFADAILEKLNIDAWQPATLELGADSLYLGSRIAVGGLGEFLTTEQRDQDILHLHAHSEFSRSQGISTTKTRIARFIQQLTDFPTQIDDSSEFIGSNYNYSTDVATLSFGATSLKYKTGSIPATEPITITVRLGDSSGAVIFQRTYPSSLFTANSTVEVDLVGMQSVNIGEIAYFTLQSDNVFSLLTDTFGLKPYYLSSV